MDLDHRGFATNVVKPLRLLVGLTRIELVTSSLSGMRSNQLSYSPRIAFGGNEPTGAFRHPQPWKPEPLLPVLIPEFRLQDQ